MDVAAGSVLGCCLRSGPWGAASAFADPAFEQAWQAGEAVLPNFWGPLPNAHDGMTEQFAFWDPPAPQQHLVQYLDKGRMERNPHGQRFPDITFNGGVSDAPSVGEVRIFAVASGLHSERQYQRLTPGTAIAPDAPPTILTYGPRA